VTALDNNTHFFAKSTIDQGWKQRFNEKFVEATAFRLWFQTGGVVTTNDNSLKRSIDSTTQKERLFAAGEEESRRARREETKERKREQKKERTERTEEAME
jgi:hypothetical protein